MTTEKAHDKNDIIVGKPLPFSIYGADKMLLLAKGQLVKNHNVREALLRNGVLPSSNSQSQAGVVRQMTEEKTTLSPLSILRQDYLNLASRSRFGLRMSREDGGESYLCWVVGYTDRRGLILTAPCREDRSFVTVTEGQTWLFRTFYATAAFRFSATIQKVLYEPFPYVHIQLPQMIDMRLVRKMPRAQLCLNTNVTAAEQEVQALIVDMSVSGVRLAMAENNGLTKDQTIAFNFTVPLLERQYPIKVQGRVMSCYGTSDVKHPRVSFYGVNFEPVSDTDQLVLHGFVQQQLVTELDSLWQVLAIDAKSG